MSTAIFEREAVHRITVRIFMNFSHYSVKKRARAGEELFHSSRERNEIEQKARKTLMGHGSQAHERPARHSQIF
jgi:hypothetical protein